MQLLTQLEQTKQQTLKYYTLTDVDLEKRYGPGKWSIRFILHHLADAETILLERIRRTISEPRPTLQVFDQDLWAERLDYQHRPLDLSKQLYSAARDNIIHYAKHHYERDSAREFVHSTDGVKTLKMVIDKVGWHNQRHLDQIAIALG